jgi:hypothetical protein
MATRRPDTHRQPGAQATPPLDPPSTVAHGDPTDPRTGAPPPGPPRYDWRDEVATASGLNVLAGIWLIIAPFVLNYRDDDPIWNDVVFGAIVFVLALVRVSGAYREHWMSWINALIGVWLFISAFWLDSSNTAGWNDVILGIIVFVLGSASASAGAYEAGAAPPERWRR